MSDEYLIWSNEHRGWWREGSRGYTRGLRDAERFDREVALRTCRDAIPTARHIGYISEIPVRLADIKAFTADYVLPRVMTHDDWD